MEGRAAHHVERDARRIVLDAQGQSGVHVSVAREIALALEALERARALFHWQLEQLLRDECTVGTDLARMGDLFAPYSRREDPLRARLLALGAERRRLTTTYTEELATHYRTLLALVQRYRLLDPPDAD